MAVFKPFKALRPTKEYASMVAALPYDVMNSEEAREMVRGNPYSFLHIDKAEIDVKGGTFVIEVKGNSPENRYIRNIFLNGTELECGYITHDQIVSGGELVIEMGSDPVLWY